MHGSAGADINTVEHGVGVVEIPVRVLGPSPEKENAPDRPKARLQGAS